MSVVEAEPTLYYQDLLARLDVELNDIATFASSLTFGMSSEAAAAQAPVAETANRPADVVESIHFKILPAVSEAPMPTVAPAQFEAAVESAQLRTRVGEKLGAMLGKTWRAVSGQNFRERHAAEQEQAGEVLSEAFARFDPSRRHDHRRFGYPLFGIVAAAALIVPGTIVVASAKGSPIGIERLENLGKFPLPGPERASTATHPVNEPAALGAFRRK